MASDISNGFGKRITQLRERVGLSTAKFAAKVGFDRTYVYKLEKGQAENPSLKFIESVVAEFGVDREWLIGGTGDGATLHIVTRPHRSGFDGHIQNRLGLMEELIETYTDGQLEEVLRRIGELAEKEKLAGKLFEEITNVVGLIQLRRMKSAAGSKPEKKSKSK